MRAECHQKALEARDHNHMQAHSVSQIKGVGTVQHSRSSKRAPVHEGLYLRRLECHLRQSAIKELHLVQLPINLLEVGCFADVLQNPPLVL